MREGEINRSLMSTQGQISWQEPELHLSPLVGVQGLEFLGYYLLLKQVYQQGPRLEVECQGLKPAVQCGRLASYVVVQHAAA